MTAVILAETVMRAIHVPLFTFYQALLRAARSYKNIHTRVYPKLKYNSIVILLQCLEGQYIHLESWGKSYMLSQVLQVRKILGYYMEKQS